MHDNNGEGAASGVDSVEVDLDMEEDKTEHRSTTYQRAEIRETVIWYGPRTVFVVEGSSAELIPKISLF